MKNTAKFKNNGSSVIRADSSLLLVSLLVMAIVAFVVWAFISINPGKTPNAQTAASSGSIACGLGSTSVVAGSNLGFGYNGFPAGQKIFVWDGGVSRIDLGTTLAGSQLVSFKIPSSASSGKYGGFIENVPNPSVTCGPVAITASTSSTAFCTLTPDKVRSGDKLTITRNPGTTIYGEVNMQNSSNLAITKLGILSGEYVSVAVPAGVLSGTYYVRVGSLGAPCKGIGNVDLTILPQIQVGTNRCDFNKDTVFNSGDHLLMAQNLGKVVPGTISGMMDLNYDGYINSGDQAILANYISTKNPKYCTTLQ